MSSDREYLKKQIEALEQYIIETAGKTKFADQRFSEWYEEQIEKLSKLKEELAENE